MSNKSISKTEAIGIAREVHRLGGNNQKMAAELEKAGYVSPHTRKPLSPSGAYYLAFYSGGRMKRRFVRRTPGEAKTITANKPEASCLAMVRSILNGPHMLPEDKIALAVLAIDSVTK